MRTVVGSATRTAKKPRSADNARHASTHKKPGTSWFRASPDLAWLSESDIDFASWLARAPVAS